MPEHDWQAEARAALAAAPLPRLPYGDAGPVAPGRGPVHPVAVPVETSDGVRALRAMVARRGPRGGLYGLDREDLRQTGMRYADLAERVASVAPPPPDGPSGGGLSDGGAFTRMRLAGLLAACVAAIGAGAVPLGPVRHRSHGQQAIPLRRLVDLVCLRGWTVGGVLDAHRWPRSKGNRRRVVAALVAALERMAAVVG